MARRSKYAEDRIRLRIATKSDKETQKFLANCFKKYLQPTADFMEPRVEGEDTITVLAEGVEIGEMEPADEEAYYRNIGNANRSYLDVVETEEDSGVYLASAVIVVKKAITEDDVKKAKRNRYMTVIMLAACVLVVGISSLAKGQTFDGVVCIVFTGIILWRGLFRKGIKDDNFYKNK